MMTQEQLNNLKALRALGRRILAEPERYPLGFGGWDCGTHACLSGWWGRENQVRRDLAFDESSILFGLGADDAVRIFGTADTAGHPDADEHCPAAYAELERRLAYLDTLIAEHEPQAPKLRGLPESITRIFDGELVIEAGSRQGRSN